MIEVRGLTKSFDGVRAVAGIDLTVDRGELMGLLGPNGAGKTTTLNMLTGLARPEAGTIRVAGIDCTRDPKAAQHLFGVVPDDSNLYPELTGLDNLTFCASLYGMGRAERTERARLLLEEFGLGDAAHRKFGGYSRGMKRRLTIAAGIIHRPAVLFLDEPTTGIDVASARQVRQLVRDLHRGGTTILLTTHYIEEAERLCDRVAFMVEGRIVTVDTLENLLSPVSDTHVLVLVTADPTTGLTPELERLFPHLRFEVVGAREIRVESRQPIAVGPLIREIEERGATVMEARRERPSLESVFARITGIHADQMKREKERKGGGGGAS
ncbi:MAG: ABC transporter ATP-binding protein [Armatimonadota bacterium]|jgi:ABC-2 type transport system ATP-binding protein